MRVKRPKRNPHFIANCVFGGLLFCFIAGAYMFDVRDMTPTRDRILGLFAAALAASWGYFLAGTVGVFLSGESPFGTIVIRAAGATALFVLVLLWWRYQGSPLTGQSGGTGQPNEVIRAAWQVINAAEGKSGDGGRTSALHDLDRHGATMQSVHLAGADLSGLILTNNPNLLRASFENARLDNSIVLRANCNLSDFSRARLNYVTFRNCSFGRSSFISASTKDGDFYGCNFTSANFGGATFSRSSLAATDLSGANVAGASFVSVNFANANLTNLEGWRTITTFSNCNVYGIRNPPAGLLEWATNHGALQINVNDFSVWTNQIPRGAD